MNSAATLSNVPDKVRILIVENSAADVQLLKREIEAAGWDFVTQIVDNPVAFEKALKEFVPDVILCEYTMPHFRGLDALKLALKWVPETPFIFVSDTISEEVAIDAVKSGAMDYVLKHNLRRLVLLLERALREAGYRKEARRAEEAQKELESRWRAIFENAVFGIYQITPDGRFLLANSTMARMLGYDSPEDLIANVTDIASQCYWDPEDQKRIKEIVESQGSVSGFEARFKRKDGCSCWLSIYERAVRDPVGKTLLYEGFVEDVSARKELEAQVQQSQKMEMIGALASGIAHDFNNMLQVVIGMTELAAEKLPPDHPARHDLNRVIEAASRATDLTQKILTFARSQPVQAQPVDVRSAISALSSLLSRTLGSHIQIRETHSDYPLIVIVDPTQFDQVLMNLATNAKDAMPNGGTLTMTTRPVEIGPEISVAYNWVKPGRFAEISVSDTGIGMTQEVVSRIFEPFFTTKDRGTGLGLSIVYGIIKACGGFITAQSEVGKGTTFRIFLPLAPPEITSASSVPIVQDKPAP